MTQTLRIAASALYPALDMALECIAGSDSGRPALEGIHLRSLPGHRLEVAAADGFRIITTEIELFTLEMGPDGDDVDFLMTGVWSVKGDEYISVKAALTALKRAARKRAEVTLRLKELRAELVADDASFWFHREHASFPEIDALIPAAHPSGSR